MCIPNNDTPPIFWTRAANACVSFFQKQCQCRRIDAQTSGGLDQIGRRCANIDRHFCHTSGMSDIISRLA